MTNQRFSLARLTAGGMLVLAAFGASAQEMPRNGNPFQRPQATSPSTVPPASLAERTPGAAEPLTLPPPIPVPAEGSLSSMKLPPPAKAGSSAPELPPPTPAAGDNQNTAPALAPTKAAGPAVVPVAASTVPARPRAFLSREKIEANRARCQVDFKGRTLMQLPAGETEQAVRMVGADGCLTAVSADADWLDAQYAGNNELLVSVQTNDQTASRRGEITIVTPSRTFVLTVRQAGAEPAPAPVAAPAALETKPTKSAVVAAAKAVPLEETKVTAAPQGAAAQPVPTPVAPKETAVTPPEEQYDAAQARLADVGDMPIEAGLVHSVLLRANRAEPSVSVILAEPLSVPTTFELPEVAEEAVPLRSLALLAEKESPVHLLTAAELGRQVVPALALPTVAAPAPIAPVVPPSPVAVEPAAIAADPARAQSVLRAFSQNAPAIPAEAGKPVQARTPSHAAAAVPKAASPATHAKSVVVPDGYVTLDDYDTTPPAKKQGR